MTRPTRPIPTAIAIATEAGPFVLTGHARSTGDYPAELLASLVRADVLAYHLANPWGRSSMLPGSDMPFCNAPVRVATPKGGAPW